MDEALFVRRLVEDCKWWHVVVRLTWPWPLVQIPVCVRHCFVAACVCSSGVRALGSSTFNRSRIRAFLPVPSLALDGVSSCQRLAGNQGTSFLTASSRDARRSVSSVAWVLRPNSAQLCQKLKCSEFKPLGPSCTACQQPALYLL